VRILAIRGRNLASLAGDFAIDFEAPPLAGAGIFAITGPTGAGKSTLLDAVCLALFNDIPRLRSAPASGRIGGEDDDSGLSLKDSRAILRHGAGDGYAEVDFAMPGGARYRARWSIKRARGKADGRLQKVELGFERLDTGERLGGTLTETLGAIRDVVGLTVEQFGRAVLLAQGDFDAFIRADANERAVLLERLTGSEIYAQLGRQAFEKAQALREELDNIRRDIALQNGLDDSQRTEAEAQLAHAQLAENAALARCATLAAARQWEERGAQLAQLVAEAGMQAANAQSARDAAGTRRIALARDCQAFALAADWTAVTQAVANRDHAAAQAEAGERTAAAARVEQARTRQIAEAARAAQVAEAARASALAPELEQARALDLRLDGAVGMLAAAHADAEARLVACKDAERAESDARAGYTKAASDHGGHSEWLAARPGLAALTAREAEIAAQLADYAAECAALAGAQAELAGQEAAQTAALARWSEAEAKLNEAIAQHETAQRHLVETSATVPPEHRLAELTEARDRIARVEALLTAHAGAGDALTGAELALADLRVKQAEIDHRRHELAEQHAALLAEIPLWGTRLADSQRELEMLAVAATRTAEELRASLQPGQPCPVCGSAEHPVAVFEGKLGEHLAARRAALAALTREHTAREQAAVRAATELELLAGQAGQSQREIAEHAQAVEDKVRRRDLAHGALMAAAQEAGLPQASAGLQEALSTRRAETDAALAALQSARAAEAAARADAERARATLDKARTSHEAARETLAARTRALDEFGADLARRRDRAAGLATALDRWLGPVEPEWRVLARPGDWLAGQAEEWNQRESARSRLAGELPALRDASTRAEAALVTARGRGGEAAEALQAATVAHAGLSAERAVLLDGEQVVAVERRLSAASEAAVAQVQAADDSHARAANALAAAAASLAEQHKQRENAELAHVRAEADFERALREFGLVREDVARVTMVGEAALAAESGVLEALDRGFDLAAGLLRQREDDLARHEASTRPELTGTELAAAIVAAENDRAAAANQRGEAELKLRLDDAVRARTEVLRAELERRLTKADVWLRLGQLIGDAKGANFRRFAQGLTLDRLLEHANARLSDLKPRYTLQRGAGGDMLIEVIDNDMGGQVRGLHNLSGGERFLASLALALGLAEMSTANGVKIETLFIDEGFGALDPASLGQAVALLEHLHASGRRVGVISHVEELKERIAAKIEVIPTGRGTSRIAVTAG